MAGERSSGRWARASAAAALLALAVAVVAGGQSARAGTRLDARRAAGAPATLSRNWAGYAVTGGQTSYTSVTATWVEPKVDCGAGGARTAAAFWVGLGGYGLTARGLEQVGTASECDPGSAGPTYYAWYELVPNPSVTIGRLAVAPGDVITTSVNALPGGTIELQVKNRTRHATFTTRLRSASPDLSSAEWIAEAPSDCTRLRCRTIPLSDFGSVGFTRIAALGNGIGGTLTANPGWTTTAITLVPGRGRGFFTGPDAVEAGGPAASATPSPASAGGRRFSVRWSNARGRSG
jgi:hypothetical protein